MKNTNKSLKEIVEIFRQLQELFPDQGGFTNRKEAECLSAKARLIGDLEDLINEMKGTLDHLLFIARSMSTARIELNSREPSDFDQRGFELCEKINRLTARFHLLTGEPESSEEPAIDKPAAVDDADALPQFGEFHVMDQWSTREVDKQHERSTFVPGWCC